jgi:transcriptional regulator with PAS, ATPase and Fis domain
MFESIKTKLWDLLKEKEVSLAMVFDRKGTILWHRGRNIEGRTVEEGKGFSKSFMKKILGKSETIEEEDVLITTSEDDLPESAHALKVKGLIIQPINDNFYLYIDSGTKDSFTRSDRDVFKVLGELLGNMIQRVKESEAEMGGITGESESIKNIRELVLKYSLEEEPVLLLGETGVGKSHIAEMIHRYSGRQGKFVTINTPGIPENLFESEVFGYKKGAFTDARENRRGYVDEAAGGTLFFDEILEIPDSFQAKLLRFIDTQKYTVLGEPAEKEANVRIIAATNRALHKDIKSKTFREDLYFRLQVLEIEIPPLRARKEDIRALVMEKRYLLKGKEVGNDFWEAVYKYNWPGNVRELITVLTRAGILLESPISGKDIHDIIHQSRYKKSLAFPVGKGEKIWKSIKGGKSFWDEAWQPFMGRDIDRETIKWILRNAYTEGRNSFKNMIRVLNLKPDEYHNFMTLMHRYRIDPRKSSVD